MLCIFWELLLQNVPLKISPYSIIVKSTSMAELMVHTTSNQHAPRLWGVCVWDILSDAYLPSEHTWGEESH